MDWLLFSSLFLGISKFSERSSKHVKFVMATRNIAATTKVSANLLIAKKLFSVLQTLTEMLTTRLYFTSGHIYMHVVIYCTLCDWDVCGQMSYCSLKYITGIRDEICKPEGFQRITSTRTVNICVNQCYKASSRIITRKTFQSFLRLVHMMHLRTVSALQCKSSSSSYSLSSRATNLVLLSCRWNRT